MFSRSGISSLETTMDPDNSVVKTSFYLTFLQSTLILACSVECDPNSITSLALNVT